MIPLLIIAPLSVAVGGLLGLARERVRRRRLSAEVVETSGSGGSNDSVQMRRNAIAGCVMSGVAWVVVSVKNTTRRIRVHLRRVGDRILLIFTRLGDKSGAFGSVIAAMGCAVCFPALASLGAAIGLGFLTQWEDLFMSTLIPLLAWVALLANALGWFAHRQWHRSLIGMAGPILILLSLYPWFMYPWFKLPLFAGLFLMVAVAIWDLTSPAHRRCDVSCCDEAGLDFEGR